MTLPRYALPEDDDDSTAPAQFLLKLPPSYARRLAEISPPTPGEWMLPIAPAAVKEKPWRGARVVAAFAGVAVAVAIIAGVGGALAQSSEGPVGISKHAPKKLDHAVRTPTWQSGVAQVVHAPATHAQRAHAKRKH